MLSMSTVLAPLLEPLLLLEVPLLEPLLLLDVPLLEPLLLLVVPPLPELLLLVPVPPSGLLLLLEQEAPANARAVPDTIATEREISFLDMTISPFTNCARDVCVARRPTCPILASSLWSLRHRGQTAQPTE